MISLRTLVWTKVVQNNKIMHNIKEFNPNIIQNVIPMKPQAQPFQQKIRKMHPKLEPTIKKELNKLLIVKIIFHVRYT
jgi:hypothetical protein